jgi:acylphosphatase
MRIHVVARGRVQGVGFRWFVREAARRLDLAGWVLNRADGGVEVEAEGPAPAIESLRVALAKGPDGAVVTTLEELPPTSEVLPRPFTILRQS